MINEIKFGVPGSQLPARDPVRGVLAAEEAGFASMWWADRLMGWLPDGPHEVLDPFPLMGAAAVATTSIRLGTAVSDPIRRHPAQLAQTALTIQQMSGDRLILGLGCGEVAGTRPYGIPYDTPVGHLIEAIDMMQALWADGRPTDWAGSHYRLERGICGLAAKVASPPIWLAAHGPRTLRLTGTQADGWLPTAHGVEAYERQLLQIREAEQQANRAGAVEAGAFLWLVAADSTERARELLRSHTVRALGLLLPQGALATTPLPDGPWGDLLPTDPAMDDLVARIDPDELGQVLPIGNPDDISREVVRYIDAGARHIVLCDMSAASGQDNGLGMRPLDVHVAVRDAVRRRLDTRT